MKEGTVDLALGFIPNLNSINCYKQDTPTEWFCCLVSADPPLRGSTISRKSILSLITYLWKATQLAKSCPRTHWQDDVPQKDRATHAALHERSCDLCADPAHSHGACWHREHSVDDE